jgi:ribosomal protein L37E
MEFSCYSCGQQSQEPINYPCSACGVDISHLDGTALSSWQRKKWKEHTSLVTGSYIPLKGKDWNCSFDIVGYSKIPQIVEFTLNYGQWFSLPSTHGGHTNDVCITFIPEIIGSGVSKHYTTLGPMPVSGCCVISPDSMQYGHPFPVLYDWVNIKFGGASSVCRLCGTETPVGLSVCWDCYDRNGNDWTRLL